MAAAEVRADPLELAPVGPLELDPVVRAALVARLLRADLLEEAQAGLLEAAEVPADPLEADLAVPAAVVAVRIPLLIPRMAKFPTRWRLARNPTT